MLLAGAALLVASGLRRGRGRRGAEGRHPADRVGLDVDASTRRSRTTTTRGCSCTRRARSSSTTRTSAGRGRDAARPGGRRPFTVSKDGRTYTFELKQTFRFHTGAPVTAQSFADAFNRVAHPASVARDGLHAGDRRRRRRDRRQGAVDLRRPRARPLPTADPLTKPLGDFTARLTLPFFCPILPDTPLEPPGSTIQPGRARSTSPSGSSISGSS